LLASAQKWPKSGVPKPIGFGTPSTSSLSAIWTEEKHMKSRVMRKTGKLLSVLLALALVGMVPVVPAFAGEGEVETQATAAAIVLQAQEAGQLTIRNQWESAVIATQGQKDTTVSADNITTLTVAQGETITVRESVPDTTFRQWSRWGGRFASGASCAVTAMPALSAFTTDAGGTSAGNQFFAYFNAGGSLTSLPKGSFDTSKITTVGDDFFGYFNSNGSLTSLPTGSFNISNITTFGDNFFYGFNADGSLTTLPDGSFDISKITTARHLFFYQFNAGGSLTSLPRGSFDTSNITTVGYSFFSGFNFSGSLTSLPEGSFDTSKIAMVGVNSFAALSDQSNFAALSEGSVDTLAIGEDFLAYFSSGGALTALPGSFRLPKALSSAPGRFYCSNMFANSALTAGNRQVPLYFAVDAQDTFTGTDITPANPTAGTTVYVNGSGGSGSKGEWPRLDGNKGDSGNRFDTMQAIVETGWKDTGADTVIVAYGHDFPDALAASSLAGIYDAPVVLTDKDTLTTQARETIVGLNAKKAYIIGGTAVVSEEVESSLATLLGGTANVERVSGENRTATALDIYREGSESTGGWGDTAIIANGFNFADALSVSPYANVMHYPIFLSHPDNGLDADTIAAISTGGFKKVIITGGEKAVPTSVEGQLSSSGVTTERWMGDNRYETSVDIIEKSLQASGGALSLNNIVCATGFNYPDALAGGAFAGHIGTVLLLIDDGNLRKGGYTGLERIIRPRASEIGQGYVLGGAAAVSEDLLTLLQEGTR
jgi:putative cell wall-binding protein